MRKKLPWLLVAAAVVALVGINLALREDPEPDLGTYEAPPARSGDTTIVVPNPEELGGVVPDGPTGQAVPELVEGDGEPVGDEVCEHPFVPSKSGQWRRYRWTQSDQERVAILRIEAGAARQVDDAIQVVWQSRIVAADDDSELAQANRVERCVPGEWAEEPWFGILERALGLRLTARQGRWRWPATLTAGDRFRGTATFDPRRADMRPPEGVTESGMLRVTRRHRVERQETIEVPAGRFEAWRVQYEETQEFRGHGETGTGTLWVAEDVGLVKSQAENSQGITQTIELEQIGGDD